MSMVRDSSEVRIAPGPAQDLRHQAVGALVAAHPGWSVVLDRLGIDYCCHGAVPLEEACAAVGVAAELVVAELRSATPVADACPSLVGAGIDDVIDHVLWVHHASCHRELPRLAELVAKVALVHGANHPELAAVHRAFNELYGELATHLAREEQLVFPMSRQLASAERDPDAGRQFPLGQPIRVLLADHDAVGELLARLNRLTAGYRVPPDACASYSAMLQGLHAFEVDLHRHVHEENNMLFPAVLALADRLGAAA